jgi:hypothetical protein
VLKKWKKYLSNNQRKRIFLVLRFLLVPSVLIHVVYQLLLDLFELKSLFHLHQDHEWSFLRRKKKNEMNIERKCGVLIYLLPTSLQIPSFLRHVEL